MSVDNASSMELEPWLIILGEAAETALATWKIEQSGEPSLAIFSSRERAEQYAQAHCSQRHSLVQLDQTALIRLMADCFQQGTRYAALDPSESSARRLFVLREVLSAARAMLGQSKPNPKPQS